MMRWGWVVGLVGWGAVACAQTINPLPQPGASFLTDLQTFLANEDANRFAQMFQSFVVSGCIGTTSVTLSHAPNACTAYPGGFHVTEAGHIVFIDNSTCWTIVTSTTIGNVIGPDMVTYIRVPSTHYAINCTNPSQPAVPNNAAFTEKVTTSGGAITAVVDIRNMSPIGTETTDPAVPSTAWTPSPIGVAGTETTIHTTAITTGGGPLLITVQVTDINIQFAEVGRVFLKLDGALLAAWSQGDPANPTQINATATLLGMSHPAAGAHTITVTAKTQGGSTMGFTANSGRVGVLEVR